jgi:hypothetical protein
MMYAWPAIPEELFPQAEAYRRYRCRDLVFENPARYFPGSERHLHALWFDDSLRPRNLKTVRGEPVAVESPGRWNLEAGPDFHDAVLLVGREGRRVAGDVEIHISPGDWKHHGHARDPRYDNVRFHICWFSGRVDDSLFPPGTLHLALADQCGSDLESIDLTAYPYKEPRANRVFPLAGKAPDDAMQLLESAGEERLRQKTLRMAWLMQRCGTAQALYEETAAALGYKHNKAPFRTLAQRFPLAAAGQYGADWKTLYAVLLGLSGLLPGQPGTGWPAASKKELRSLWDLWWREAHRWEEIEPLGKKEWRLAGVRPLNHPVRRLCALAQWSAAGAFQTLEKDSALSAGAFPNPEPCFWTDHVGWTGKEKRAELVGPGRMKAIELNILVPCRLARGDAEALRRLPSEPMNSVIRETAYTLFGPDHSPALYRSALARQGLIQLFGDTILTGQLAELE